MKRFLSCLILSAAVFLSSCGSIPQQSGGNDIPAAADDTFRVLYAGEAETLNYLRTDSWNDTPYECGHKSIECQSTCKPYRGNNQEMTNLRHNRFRFTHKLGFN